MTYNPKEMLDTADAFYKSASVLSLELSKTKDSSLISPIFTLDSLALEMYFKCLFIIENNTNPARNHFLSSMFKSLSNDAQSTIENIYKELLLKDPHIQIFVKIGAPCNFNIYDVLDEIKDSFFEWRYLYEHKNKGFPSVQIIIEATRKYIKDISI